ncbi:hypothetical protein MTR67_008558 [Solanum verrucosum]|uniref:Uncharacterized protein n=1 Tax=Solanum verrucosum TaxID=315347 RepID=A0AAF0TGH6_SOLVR|nr:hypothetical protein MTR67_008558 [Solanum verrucosum]
MRKKTRVKMMNAGAVGFAALYCYWFCWKRNWVFGVVIGWADCIACGPGHGISIGSLGWKQQELGVQNVTIKTVTFSGTTNGVRVKTWAMPSNGFVRNILFQHIVTVNVKNPIIIDQNYCPNHDVSCPQQRSDIKISEVTYQDIHGTSTTKITVKLDCSITNPCSGLILENLNLSYQDQQTEASCVNARGRVSAQVGTPLKEDMATIVRSRPNLAKVRIEVDFNKTIAKCCLDWLGRKRGCLERCFDDLLTSAETWSSAECEYSSSGQSAVQLESCLHQKVGEATEYSTNQKRRDPDSFLDASKVEKEQFVDSISGVFAPIPKDIKDPINQEIEQVIQQQGLSPRGDKHHKDNRLLYRDLDSIIDGPWVIGGDFNSIMMDVQEKKGGNIHTWCNGRGGTNKIRMRLDRFLHNEECCSNDDQQVIKYFRFLNFWTDQEDFLLKVKTVWEDIVQGNPMWRLHKKLKTLAKELSKWSRECIGDVFQRVKELEHEVTSTCETSYLLLDAEADRKNLNRSKAEYIRWLKTEDSILRQNARLKWATDGDSNTKYFHSTVRES